LFHFTSSQSGMATLIAGNYDFVNADAAYEQYLKATGLSAEYARTVDLSH
jgi:hypothetical protein